MPEIKSGEIAIALDMYGCPNRCRHCWLGLPQNRPMDQKDLRWAAAQFRQYVRKGETRPFIDKLGVMSWFREPDFSDDYERLYELEAELSDVKPYRFELLSVWRLARDENYAEWAKKVGPDTCQISFFGMEETNDWFYRRKGAFRDNLTATERLLDVGMKPRWQVFLTKKLIPEMGELLRLVDRLKLKDKVRSLGGDFVLFMHTPGPDGEARKIEYLRPTLEDTASIPGEIIESSKKHMKGERLWHTEAELVSEILTEEEQFPYAYSYPEILCFYIQNNWDVFSNMGTLEPWWKLGNLKTDSVELIFDAFENNSPLGLKTIFTISPQELAKRFGDSKSRLIYTNKDDLEALFVGKYCEQIYQSSR